MNCLFCKIIAGEIPCIKVYEDDKMIIINDIAPQADIHYLMIPKEHYANICEMSASQACDLGSMIAKIGDLASRLGLDQGFRIVSNKGGNGCQSVDHLHIHILGGQKLSDNMA